MRLVRLFGPEHGLDGGAIYMEAVGDVDPRADRAAGRLALRATRREPASPRREHLADLDALVFDVADVGSRYYTYVWTMLLAMEACAARAACASSSATAPTRSAARSRARRRTPGYLSFVGLHPIPVRHGMTAGELARLFAAERRLDLDLVVCPAAGWARDMPFERPACRGSRRRRTCRRRDTALVYPGMCLLEGTNLSEGRGTTRPFELFGAPVARRASRSPTR